MPIRPIPPREGKTPVWYGRGTHLGRYVDRSTGARTRALCVRVIRQWESEIERGVFVEPGEPTFASAALAYLKAGGERTYVTPLLHHFQNEPLKLIGQAAIDAAGEALYPGRSAATVNRYVHTPVSAILRRAGFDIGLHRPKGHAGKVMTGWLWPEQAFRLLEAAHRIDPEFAVFLTVLLYTGARLSEIITLTVDNVRLTEAFAYVPDTKNGDPLPLHLPPVAVSALANHPRGLNRPGETVFRYHKGGHIYAVLRAIAFKADVELPARQAFHILRHTYATWMRRFAGTDLRGLLGTDRWKNLKSVMRYAHVVASEESKRADQLPVPGRKTGAGKSVDSRKRKAIR